MGYDDDSHSDSMCLALSQMWCASIQAFFFHGDSEGPEDLEGPESLQAQWFKNLKDGYTLHAPNFSQLTQNQRTKKAAKVTHGLKEVVVIASGTGAITACLLYQKFPQRFDHLLLLSPVFDSHSMEQIKAMPSQLKIVHGLHDEIASIGHTQRFAKQFKAELIQVQDDHRLHQCLPVIEKALSDLTNDIILHS